MSSSFTIHTRGAGLMVASEYPENGGSICLTDGSGAELQLYLPIKQWWSLHCMLHPAEGYVYFVQEGRSITDYQQACRVAQKFYFAALRKEQIEREERGEAA